jgi:hypothetical protein
MESYICESFERRKQARKEKIGFLKLEPDRDEGKSGLQYLLTL